MPRSLLYKNFSLVSSLLDALFSSLILQRKADYVSQLTKWLDGESDWSLCYRASDHGWRSNVFHARCDHRGPTVTIVRVGSYIFGGYTNVSWGGKILVGLAKFPAQHAFLNFPIITETFCYFYST